MNTNNWIAVTGCTTNLRPRSHECVLVAYRSGGMAMAVYYEDFEHSGPCWMRIDNSLRIENSCSLQPDFWQPLPAPPLLPDPFEEWWAQLPVCLQGPDMRYLQGRGIKREAAKKVWEAALASAQK